jgi:pSer/pThr/pTyr-binding forkhead associated (FHA) protein
MMRPSADQFLDACGARGPVRLHVDGNGTGTRGSHLLDRPYILVGRDQGNDLCLDHPAVSDRHAYLQMLGGNLFCVDLGSKTGIAWETGRSSTGWLRPDDSLRIGPYTIRMETVESNGSGQKNGWSRPALSQPPDQVVLEFVNGRPASTWTMNRVLTLVGKAADCAIRLRAPGVADYHCSLLRTSQGLWAVGLDRHDGIHVNGEDLHWAMLNEGDELSVGKILIRVRQSLALETAAGCPIHNGFTHPPSAVPDDVLMPLLGQFTALQRQMFDQFQQAVYMMVEMFKKMEREHTDLIRREVDRIHDITEELKLLQMELGHQTPVPRGAETAQLQHRAVAARPPDSWRLPPWTDPAGSDAERSDELPATGEPPASTEAELEMHTWLYDQITTLQRERETRLQKLMNFLSGQR